MRLFLLELDSGTLREVSWNETGSDYLARVAFAPDGALAVQRQSRDQQRLDLLFIDPETGARAVALTERSDTWVNLHSDLHFLEDGGRFLWTSERDGHRHLYLFERDGTLVRQVTRGDWSIADTSRGGGGVRALDETRDEAW